MIIREIELKDIEDFIALSKQLGYEVEKEYVAERIGNEDDSELVFVAEEDRVIGWINLRINRTYLSKPYGEIVGFIVDEIIRNKGIGKKLLEKAELWFKMKGVSKILLHTNVKRIDAHRFYERNGYKYIKDSKLLRKEFGNIEEKRNDKNI